MCPHCTGALSVDLLTSLERTVRASGPPLSGQWKKGVGHPSPLSGWEWAASRHRRTEDGGHLLCLCRGLRRAPGVFESEERLEEEAPALCSRSCDRFADARGSCAAPVCDPRFVCAVPRGNASSPSTGRAAVGRLETEQAACRLRQLAVEGRGRGRSVCLDPRPSLGLRPSGAGC